MFQKERQILLDQYGKVLWTLRAFPSHAAHWVAGVYLPPHERLWLGIMFSEYRENNIVASRGTSKSFTHASFAAPLYDSLHINSTTLVVSASGFRGGKLLFDDVERLFKGQLRDQRMNGDYLINSVDTQTKNKVLTRQPDMWYIKHKAHGRTLTIPTNNADAMRGIRATTAIIDERNTFDGEVVQKVIRPMLNVGKEFRRTAKGVGNNKVFQVSTIDYTFRDWYPEITTQTDLAKREYEAHMARKAGDWIKYEELMSKDRDALRSASFSITRVDYTDLLIPTEVLDSEDGKIYEVEVPRDAETSREDVCMYDYRDKCYYWYLYPVDKKQLEDPYLDGTMDEDLWMAEQRNVFISASGNVYPHEMIVKASERPIYKSGDVPGYGNQEDFHAPVLYKCGDPCVIGLDYARESDEFALVVIRLGPLSDYSFDPTMGTMDDAGRPILGKTDWSNVIWAESWRHMTAASAADKIRELKTRYNVIHVPMIGGGIGLDKGGGGTAVRDNLAIPKPPMISGQPDPSWEMPQIIFDPEDEDYAHFLTADDPENYWAGLELIKPTNQTNLDSTMASKAMLQKQQLYIGYYEAPSQWARRLGLINAIGGVDDSNPLYHATLVGYKGISRLKSQLVRLQSKVSETGVMRFIMPGKRELEEGKKDLYSAFIYATYMARHHLVGLTKEGMYAPPTTQPIIVKVGSKHKSTSRNKGRGWRNVQWRQR